MAVRKRLALIALAVSVLLAGVSSTVRVAAVVVVGVAIVAVVRFVVGRVVRLAGRGRS